MIAHFLFSSAEILRRDLIQEDPIRSDPDSSQEIGQIIREGLKHEEIEIKIKLISSGNTSKLPDQFILADIGSKLNEQIK
jgi:hypothetical protein